MGSKNGGVRSILLAEDDDNLRFVLRQVLESFDYVVFEARDGDSVADIYSLHPEVDLAMLDVSMPGISGVTAAQGLLHQRPDLPVLFMTGYSQDMVMCNGDLNGAFRVLSKPFHFDQLREVIQQLLEMPVEGNCGECPVNVEQGCIASLPTEREQGYRVTMQGMMHSS